ncbi:hypothetical protein GCM10027020_04690 [Nocardioides salsibiostraticola]
MVTVLALATMVVVGFLLFSGGEDTAPVDQSSPRADTTPAAPPASPTVEPTATLTPTPTLSPTPTPTPAPTPTTAAEPAVAPVGAGRCPKGARVKGETADSGDRIYYRPGFAEYGDTRAQECFASAADAEAAGYSPSDSQ